MYSTPYRLEQHISNTLLCYRGPVRHNTAFSCTCATPYCLLIHLFQHLHICLASVQHPASFYCLFSTSNCTLLHIFNSLLPSRTPIRHPTPLARTSSTPYYLLVHLLQHSIVVHLFNTILLSTEYFQHLLPSFACFQRPATSRASAQHPTAPSCICSTLYCLLIHLFQRPCICLAHCYFFLHSTAFLRVFSTPCWHIFNTLLHIFNTLRSVPCICSTLFCLLVLYVEQPTAVCSLGAGDAETTLPQDPKADTSSRKEQLEAMRKEYRWSTEV